MNGTRNGSNPSDSRQKSRDRYRGWIQQRQAIYFTKLRLNQLISTFAYRSSPSFSQWYDLALAEDRERFITTTVRSAL
jgi:hypothetical protein